MKEISNFLYSKILKMNDCCIHLKNWLIIYLWMKTPKEVMDILLDTKKYMYVTKKNKWSWYFFLKNDIDYISEDLDTYYWKDDIPVEVKVLLF